MNRVFKTKWSVAHQEYVVTDEKHTTKTKTAKSAVALAVAALMLGAGVASAAYMDPGFVAKNSTQLEQAKKSWETAEYQKDWGLAAMNASTAYALGYHGQNTAVAVMDSGALLQKHPELAGDRFHASHATGVNMALPETVIRRVCPESVMRSEMVALRQKAKPLTWTAIGDGT